MKEALATAPRLFASNGHLVGRFAAMGCPCEILIDTDDAAIGRELLSLASDEAKRIEAKFSRYRSDSIVQRINTAGGAAVQVDDETGGLLDFADTCYRMSDGRFDITSGVLRRVWRFDGGSHLPSKEEIDRVRSLVGWDKVTWKRPFVTLPAGMEIDLGGIGKEYAVDRALALCRAHRAVAILINFGGDIAAAGQRRNEAPWTVGIERPDHGQTAVEVIELWRGAITTSGDSKKFILKNGIRYGHILNPATGCPVEGAPRSVTVAATTCTEAGFLSTLAILHGPNAESVLENSGRRYWCFR